MKKQVKFTDELICCPDIMVTDNGNEKLFMPDELPGKGFFMYFIMIDFIIFYGS